MKNNAKAISNFLAVYQDETAKEMASFLFDLQGSYLTQAGEHLSDRYKTECRTKFIMLFDLVTTLQPAKAAKENKLHYI